MTEEKAPSSGEGAAYNATIVVNENPPKDQPDEETPAQESDDDADEENE